MNQAQRLHSLDNLRALMMWLGIVLHVAANHMIGEGPIPWRDPETTLLANLTIAFIHTFRMPVFFILAGFFVALLMARRGAGGMLKHRLRRIGLPFLGFWPPVFFCTGALILRYFELMSLEQEDVRALLDERPRVGTMHLWFLYYLLWFCACAALCGRLAKHVPAGLRDGIAGAWHTLAARWWGFLVLTLPLAATGAFYWNGIVTPDGSFLPRITEFVHNGLFFAFGYYLYRHQNKLLPQYADNCWRYLAGGLAFYLAAGFEYEQFLSNGHAPPPVRASFAFLYHCASWLWSFALVGLFMRYLPAQNRVLAFVADSSYWVYLVHFPVVVGFGVLLYEAPYGALAKIGINLAATTATCLLSYLLLARYTPVSMLLNGRSHALPLSPRKLGLVCAALFALGIGISQIKFDANDAPVNSTPPQAVAVPDDIGRFLDELGNAYGNPDGAKVAQFLSQDFRHQGMNREAFLDHMEKNRHHFGKLKIIPVGLHRRPDQPGQVELSAYAVSAKGVPPPALHLLPLQAGAALVQEGGKWKLHGNQRDDEVALYRQLRNVVADFAPSDPEVYRRHLPPGFSMPERPWIRVSVTAWERTGAPHHPYRSAQLSILASRNGENFWHLLAMPETDWLAVESGMASGFPRFVANIDIRRSLGNQWQVALRRDGTPLAEVSFDPVVMTKSSTYREDWPNNVDDWLIFDKDGAPLKAYFRELAPPRRASSSFGWMTVNPQAPLWQALLAPGSRALAMHYQGDGAYKLHTYPLADTALPDGIQQLLDANAAAWARRDMDAVLALYHPAFKVTNQKDLAAMRRLFLQSQRYEWRVKELREDGDFAYLRGEIGTETGAIPASARLLRENGRWVFYGDGGSWDELRRTRPAAVASGGTAAAIDADTQERVQEVLAKADDLQFSKEAVDLGALSSLGNAIFKPVGHGPFPALVLLPDCSGRIGNTMRRRVQTAVSRGYVVMVVDSLRGHPNNCVAPLRISFERRTKDADDALAHLSKLPQVDPQRIAVAGYSQGGTVALLLASRGVSALYPSRQRFAAAVAWYPLCYLSGRYARKEIDFLRPDIDAPLLLLMGGADIYTPAHDCVPHLEELQADGVPVEWQVYPQAVHGWDLTEASGISTLTFRGDRMTFSHDAPATQQGQQQMYDFLKRRMAGDALRQAGTAAERQQAAR